MHATSVMMRLIDTAFLPVLPLGHGFRKPTTEGGIAKAERSTTSGGPGGRQRCSVLVATAAQGLGSRGLWADPQSLAPALVLSAEPLIQDF